MESRVEFGLQSSTLLFAEENRGMTTEHEVKLSHLLPDTLYYYRVGNRAGRMAGLMSFRSAPAAGAVSSSLRVWVLGDCGTGTVQSGLNGDLHQNSVRDSYKRFAAASTPASIMVLLGDNAYWSGSQAEVRQGRHVLYLKLAVHVCSCGTSAVPTKLLPALRRQPAEPWAVADAGQP